MSFTTWALEKKVKQSDLIFLRALTDPLHLDLFHKVADRVVLLRPTFSESLPLFEQLTDLILMGHAEELFLNLENLEAFRGHLKTLRYPHTSKRDDELKIKMEALPWPYGSKVKFERRGDRAGIELKVFISSDVDLTKIMASLERVQKELT